MTTRILLILLSLFLLNPAADHDRSRPAVNDAVDAAVETAQADASLTVIGGSEAQRDRLALALDRFDAAGLPLPDLEVVFTTSNDDCHGHYGLFTETPTPWRIVICSDADFVYEHELAHAWERHNLTAETRYDFMERRGYTVWSSHSVDWNERGVEGVALVIQQGISGLPLRPAMSTERISRLEAYELLTGSPAPTLITLLDSHEVPCMDRPTPLSRLLPDASGDVCDGPSPVAASRIGEQRSTARDLSGS